MLTRGDPPPFMKFRDASNITPVFEISLRDCLAGLEKALTFRFFDMADFNSGEYEYYEVSYCDGSRLDNSDPLITSSAWNTETSTGSFQGNSSPCAVHIEWLALLRVIRNTHRNRTLTTSGSTT